MLEMTWSLLAALFAAPAYTAAVASSSSVYTGTYYAKSIPTASCITQPAATSTLAAYSGTVKSQQYTVFGHPNGDTAPQVLLHTHEKQPQPVIFDLRNSSRIQYYLQDGKSGYLDNGGVHLFSANCDTEVHMAIPNLYKKAQHGTHNSHKRELSSQKRGHTSQKSELIIVPAGPRSAQAENVDVDVTVKDQCGNPVPDLSARLACAQAGFPSKKYDLDDDDDGEYYGSCPFPDPAELKKSCADSTKTNLDYITGDGASALSTAGGLGAKYLEQALINGVTTEVIGESALVLVAAPALELVGLGLLAMAAFGAAMYAYSGFTSNAAGVAKLSGQICNQTYSSWEYQVYAVLNTHSTLLGAYTQDPGTIQTVLHTKVATQTCTPTSASTHAPKPEPTGKGTNLLPDPSFEEQKWTLANGASYGTADGAYSGNTYLQLEGNGTARQRVATLLHPQQNYNMSLALRPWHLTKDCFLVMVVSGAKENSNTAMSIDVSVSGSSYAWLTGGANVGKWGSPPQDFVVELMLAYGDVIIGAADAEKTPCRIDVDDVALTPV